MANETNPRVRSGPSNNDHSEQMTKKLNRRNGTHQNVRTNARHYHGAVVGSTGTRNLGSKLVTGSAERVASSTGGGTSDATSSENEGSISESLGRLFFETLIRPALDLTIRVVDNRPRDVISGKVKEQTLPQDQPQETQEQAAPPQTPRESPPRQEEPTTLIDNKMLKLERDQQAQTSMNDLREEVQDEVFDDGEDNHVAEDTDEGPNNNTEEDEDEEIVYRYGSDEEAKEIGEEQGFSSLLNDETIHMTHIKEHTDVDEEKEKVEDLVKYMTNSLQENDQLVNTLSGLSDDITMFLRK